MLLKDVMTHNVAVASPDETIEQAARTMKELDVGPLPVCEGNRVVGMLTDRDIAVRSTAAGCDPKAARVRDVMTTDVVSCFEDEDARKAPGLMTAKRIRRLLVLSRANSLVGIASRGDLAAEAAWRWQALCLVGIASRGDLAAEAARRLLAPSRAEGPVGMGMGATPWTFGGYPD